MIPFLQSVALAYSSRYPDLSEICFLFPNKRSGRFFLKYLRELNTGRTVLAPEVKTVSDFVSDLSRRAVASRLDLLFMLFEEYRNLLGLTEDDEDVTFESFRIWGETMLNDFSEVDQYLASPEEVFKNVKDYRELTTNFLSDDQKDVMKEYFGHIEFGDTGKFWKNFDKEDKELGEAKRKFVHLWRLMLPLYKALSARLEKEGLTTKGGNSRLALERLRESGREVLPYKKVVAVGFNALTTSEFNIFRSLKSFDGYCGYDAFADFIWDATGPVFERDINSASKFIKADISHFPAPEWIKSALRLSSASEMPSKIRIEISPSNSAQTKIAGILLRELYIELGKEAFTKSKIAVVLPDENLLLPMLYSLPNGIGEVNLTMGYSLRLTSVVPYVSLLRRLLINLRKTESGIGFYHRALRQFMTHPYNHCLAGTAKINGLLGEINDRHMSVVPVDLISSYVPKIGEILVRYSDEMSPVSTIAWLDSVLVVIIDTLDSNSEGEIKQKLDKDHISVYRDGLNRLSDIISQYNIKMKPSTVFRLIDTLLAGETIGFEGEPLSGLQVMGTLETRSLDFEHLFILSANEKVLPRRSRTRSFIPDTLRRAFGMPPSNYAEEMFSYYFYRMISRAKSVTIIYDGRDGGDNGDVSRYIQQLRHLFADNGRMKEREWKFMLSSPEESDPSVVKTEAVRKVLQCFLRVPSAKNKSENDTLNFSASSLNVYRECGVRFFYQCVMGISPDRQQSEYIDAITSGNVLHRVMQNIYLPPHLRGKYLRSGVVMKRETLIDLLDKEEHLWREVVRSINKEHFHLNDEECDRQLPPGAVMIGRKILNQVKNIVSHDLELAPFTIYGLEITELMRVKLKSGKTINFRFAIDRLDEITIDGKTKLRIVDYKTGKLKLECEDIDDLFTDGYKKEQAFQLFVYSWLLHKREGIATKGDERLEVYNANATGPGISNLPRIGGEEVTSCGEFSQAFDENIEAMIESVFEDGCFEAAPKTECSLCGFRDLCRR